MTPTEIAACLFLLAVPTISYLVILSILTRGWYQRNEHRAQAGLREGDLPQVTVVIAARNEEENLQNILGDLAGQDYPQGLMEVIVVNDGSSDATERIARSFIESGGLENFRLIDSISDYGNKKNALAAGISAAHGAVILTTDADCRVGKGWITAMAGCFRDTHTAMVAGPVALDPVQGLTGRFQALEFLGLVASGAGAALAGHPFLCNGASLAYRKAAFQEVDGFSGNDNYRSGDDVFLMHKIKKHFGNHSILFCRDEQALVHTRPVSGIQAFLRQRARWASKSPGYRDAFSLWVAGIVFTFCLAVLSAFFAGFFHPRFFLAAAGMIVLKMIADLPLLLGITRFTGQERLMHGYIFFQLIYPVYVIIAAILSIFRRKSW